MTNLFRRLLVERKNISLTAASVRHLSGQNKNFICLYRGGLTLAKETKIGRSRLSNIVNLMEVSSNFKIVIRYIRSLCRNRLSWFEVFVIVQFRVPW